MLKVYIVVALVVGIAGIIIYRVVMRQKRRARLLALPLTDVQIDIIRGNVTIYDHLPKPYQVKLAGLVQVFIAEKVFVGCKGLVITEEIKLSVASQASILLLELKHKYYPKLKTIYMYPSSYVSDTIKKGAGGMAIGGKTVRSGESWQNGPVALAWDDVKRGAYDIRDGQNVVMHEFAHRLDQEDGTADGTPILGEASKYVTWANVLGKEFVVLKQKVNKSSRHVMNAYGATNEAEFFAVATETFFEKSKKLKRKHPELYSALQDYYQLDPVNWGK